MHSTVQTLVEAKASLNDNEVILTTSSSGSEKIENHFSDVLVSDFLSSASISDGIGDHFHHINKKRTTLCNSEKSVDVAFTDSSMHKSRMKNEEPNAMFSCRK